MALPDFMKTEAALRLEYAAAFRDAAPARLEAVRARLDYMRAPGHDVEVWVPLQSLGALVAGQDVWHGMGAAARREQFRHMAEIYDGAYPNLRLHPYDLRDVYASPFTVFGSKRAVLFLGEVYLVLNGSDHIRASSRRFDDLIRRAAPRVRSPRRRARRRDALRITGAVGAYHALADTRQLRSMSPTGC